MNDGSLVSEDEMAEIKMRCEKATSGPWKSYLEGREKMSGSDFIMTGAKIFISQARPCLIGTSLLTPGRTFHG
jgi:hypothetical protein